MIKGLHVAYLDTKMSTSFENIIDRPEYLNSQERKVHRLPDIVLARLERRFSDTVLPGRV